MDPAVRVILVILGFVVAGFAAGFLLEVLVGGSDSGAPLAGGVLGLGLAIALLALTARQRSTADSPGSEAGR